LTHDTPTQEYIDEGDVGGLTTQARWRKGEGYVKTLLGTSVPDNVFNRISEGGTAKGVWDALKQDYEDRSLMTTVDLVRRFRTKKCGEKDNIRTHFQELTDLRDQLAAVGKSVDNDDFAATLLASLPPSFVHACTSINSSGRVGAKNLTPTIAKEIVLEEYHRRVTRYILILYPLC